MRDLQHVNVYINKLAQVSLYHALNHWCFEIVKCCAGYPRTFNHSALPSPKVKILGMSNHTWFSNFKFLFHLCVWEGDTHRVQKRASDQISETGVTYSCEPMWLLEASRFAGKERITLNLQASSLAPSELICNEIWNQLLWTMTVSLLNADTLPIQLNSFPYISWVAYIVQHYSPSPAASINTDSVDCWHSLNWITPYNHIHAILP